MLITDLKINPLFENLLPPLTDDELESLKQDICNRQKVIDPILVWSKDNSIVDGHNRYKIIKSFMIPDYKIEKIDFDSESDAMSWIVEHQFAKRNLTKSQQVILLQKVEEQVAKEAKERQKQAGGDKKSEEYQKSVTENLPEPIDVKKKPNLTTAETMAKKLGISDKTYRDMKTVVESGSKEKIERMDKGGRGNGVSTIAQEIREGIPDGYRKCRKCGQIKPIGDFWKREGGSPGTICKECKNKQEQQYPKQKTMSDFPVDFHPDTKVVVTGDIIIEEFESVLNQSVDLFKSVFSSNRNRITSEVLNAMNALYSNYLDSINELFEKEKKQYEECTEGLCNEEEPEGVSVCCP